MRLKRPFLPAVNRVGKGELMATILIVDDAVSFGLGLGYCIWSGHSGSGCYLYDGLADQRTMATGHDTGL